VSALGDAIPRIPLMEYDEPAESVLTDDTCVAEPVDTVQRKRGSQGQQEAEGRRAPVLACHKCAPIHWTGCSCGGRGPA
jgi:hypothetical protein